MSAGHLIVILLLGAALAFCVSVMGGMVQRRWPIMDRVGEPHKRIIATPTAGGISLVVAVLLALWFGVWSLYSRTGGEGFGSDINRLVIVSLGLGAVTVMGLVDDLRGLDPKLRLILQAVLAIVLASAGLRVEVLDMGFDRVITLNPLISVAGSAFWLVFCMNIFNFMDGVNGLVAGSASVGFLAIAVLSTVWINPVLALFAAVLLGSSAGFLVHNARGALFMGDTGSLMLGLATGALGLMAANQGTVSLWTVPIVFMPLFADAVMTLGGRILRRRPLTQGHREHAYQLLVRVGIPHTGVATLYAFLSLQTFCVVMAAGLFGASGGAVAFFLLALISMISLSRGRRIARAQGWLEEAGDRPAAEQPPDASRRD
jgi:UDP-GlcNAc:undecaprenyl-phosphate/decaprenyl-phosphate GlcNAc-1-phosphate transferase